MSFVRLVKWSVGVGVLTTSCMKNGGKGPLAVTLLKYNIFFRSSQKVPTTHGLHRAPFERTRRQVVPRQPQQCDAISPAHTFQVARPYDQISPGFARRHRNKLDKLVAKLPTARATQTIAKHTNSLLGRVAPLHSFDVFSSMRSTTHTGRLHAQHFGRRCRRDDRRCDIRHGTSIG